MTATDKIEPIHQGEVLMEDFIEGFAITQNKFAVSIGDQIEAITPLEVA